MTTLLEIKPYILEYVEKHLDESFATNVYWAGERWETASYPFCLLTVIAESKNHRTSHHEGEFTNNKIEHITTRYKTCTITVGVYNGWSKDTTEDVDIDVAKEFAYEQIDELEAAFEDYPVNSKFSVQRISPIRALHETVSGGYMYRFEFDLTIGYNEPTVTNIDTGKAVMVDVNTDTTEEGINFKVTIENNDTINVEQYKGVDS